MGQSLRFTFSLKSQRVDKLNRHVTCANRVVHADFFNTFCKLILNLTLFFSLKLTLLAAPIVMARRNVCAAPCMVARQTLPRNRSAASFFAMSPSGRATMHDAAQAFRRAMTIGAAKKC